MGDDDSSSGEGGRGDGEPERPSFDGQEITSGYSGDKSESTGDE